MKNDSKKEEVLRYKRLATGLFFAMCLVFVSSSISIHLGISVEFLAYVRAFSEAAMVGALADWFAVTALFNYPLGFKIPHTNLIEKSKHKIGNNLGDFVVSNFLSPENIRPYILKLSISQIISFWILKHNNLQLIIDFSLNSIKRILLNTEDKRVVLFLFEKVKNISEDIQLHEWLSKILIYLIDRKEHQLLITELSSQLKVYIVEHHDLVRSRVKAESFALIPSFVDDQIAKKITLGLAKFFQEIELDHQHPIRIEISEKLQLFASQIKNNDNWVKKINEMKSSFINSEKMKSYIEDLWKLGKKRMVDEFENSDSDLRIYIEKTFNNFIIDFSENKENQLKLDKWARHFLYKIFLKNKEKFGKLIAETVGNWEGRALSKKLELEVGKDLQFIRINGTIVGGLVGLLIYIISQCITHLV